MKLLDLLEEIDTTPDKHVIALDDAYALRGLQLAKMLPGETGDEHGVRRSMALTGDGRDLLGLLREKVRA